MEILARDGVLAPPEKLLMSFVRALLRESTATEKEAIADHSRFPVWWNVAMMWSQYPEVDPKRPVSEDDPGPADPAVWSAKRIDDRAFDKYWCASADQWFDALPKRARSKSNARTESRPQARSLAWAHWSRDMSSMEKKPFYDLLSDHFPLEVMLPKSPGLGAEESEFQTPSNKFKPDDLKALGASFVDTMSGWATPIKKNASKGPDMILKQVTTAVVQNAEIGRGVRNRLGGMVLKENSVHAKELK